MGSHYNAERKKVFYFIKWKGYPEESEWTEEPLEHLPRALVRSFHTRHPRAAMDNTRWFNKYSDTQRGALAPGGNAGRPTNFPTAATAHHNIQVQLSLSIML